MVRWLVATTILGACAHHSNVSVGVLVDADGLLQTHQLGRLPEIDAVACGDSIRYPPVALDVGEEGAVLLELQLDAEGRVTQASVRKGRGFGLDEAALHAIRNSPACRFRPALAADGHPVEYHVRELAIRFTIPTAQRDFRHPTLPNPALQSQSPIQRSHSEPMLPADP